MSTKAKSNEPQTGDLLYVNEQLKLELSQNLATIVDDINGAWGIIKKSFPNAILSRAYMWAILIDGNARDFVHTKALDDKARELGLNCAYIRSRQENSAVLEPLSQKNREDRRLFDVLTRRELRPLTEFLNRIRTASRNMETYLRIGAIVFDAAAGKASIAENAAELIEDYCSVTIANETERKFVKSVKDAQACAAALAAAYNAVAANVVDKSVKNAITDYAERGMANALLPHEPCGGKGVFLFSENADWRAMLSFVGDSRRNDGPRFFNRAGYPENVGVEFVYRATGYLPLATANLRYKYPDLYKGVPFRGANADITSSYPDDTQAAFEAIKHDRKRGIYLN